MAAQTGSIDGKRFVTMRFKRIKTWAHAYHVRQHNMRKMPCPHADGPAPRLLVGGEDVPGAIRDLLKRYGIAWKQGEVLAIEFVVSASREVFEGADDAERGHRLDALIECTRKAFEARFKIGGQIVSIALHEDETTPHIHVVVVPLVREPDLRRRDKSPQVRLSAKRIIGGQGDMAREQTRFARFFEDMGLERGRHRSRARHVPNREHEAMLEDARQLALSEARALATERDHLDLERHRDEQNRALWKIAEIKLTAKARALDQKEARLATEAEQLRSREAAVSSREVAAEELKQRALKRINALAPVMTEARAFHRRLAAVASERRTEAEKRALASAVQLSSARRKAEEGDAWLAEAMRRRIDKRSAVR